MGSNLPVSILELADFIAKRTDSRVRIFNPNTEGDIYVADNETTQRQLGVTETKIWKDSISELLPQLETRT